MAAKPLRTRHFDSDFTPRSIPTDRRWHSPALAAIIGAAVSSLWGICPVRAAPDLDGNGYVDGRDLDLLIPCLTGPNEAIDPTCPAAVDDDGDQDADLLDIAAFQRARGHLPIPLRDTTGQVIVSGSTIPYSGRQTCGTAGCHNTNQVANGFKFQQGRTDVQGNVIMRDDYFNDKRWWQRSAGRYGKCSISGSMRIFSGKDNHDESEMELTAFRWTAECSACHPGGGGAESDRDNQRFFDRAAGKFGYELLGKTADDVTLSGDYAYMDTSGNLTPARWDVTGVSDPDCLYCHTPDPAWNGGGNTGRYTRRGAVATAKQDLVDNAGQSVPAFAAIGVASQGWFSEMPIVNGRATKLQIDYHVGIDQGTLVQQDDDTIALSPSRLDFPPKDDACWLCHGPIGWNSLRGALWFDNRDFHYAKLNKLLDDDPGNDVPARRSTACNYCHPGDIDHNFAKGNAILQHSRDELDWRNLRTCRSCHLETSPTRHPDAPPVPGDLLIHQAMWYYPDALSCQACHIPMPWRGPDGMTTASDRSVTVASISYPAKDFYSADPLNPADPDKSRWIAMLVPKTDEDGVVRLFPTIPPRPQIYWADWDQRGTPDDKTDDLIKPIIQWRLWQVLGTQPLPGVTDDNGDGKPEINRPEEMLIYMNALKVNDRYGRPIAVNPVLVKGMRVWHEDSGNASGVNSFNPYEFGLDTDWAYFLGINHNVRRANEGWGHSRGEEPGCGDCHRPGTFDSPVFDRLIMVDPFGPDGGPVYEKVRTLNGYNPP